MLSFVFVNGQYQKDLSNPGDLSNHVSVDKNVFRLHLPENFKAEQSIKINHINKTAGARVFRHAITADKNSEAVIIETYEGENDIVYSNEIETKIDLKANARLQYYKRQCEGDKAAHTASMIANQARDSYLATYHVLTGAAESKDQFTYSLEGEAATCESLGFYKADRKQKITIASCIHHVSSHTNSKQLYKGMADDQSHAAFHGRIVIDSDIKAVIAHQKNNNLLLSNHAEIDTKPELEIYSNDVQCTHGATVGQLDSEALFYLQSRGITEVEAKRLLIDAFVNEILEALPEAL